MKSAFYILLFFITFLAGCDKQEPKRVLHELPIFEIDSVLINFLSSDNYATSIKHIDSLLNKKVFKGHELAVAYYEKGRNLLNQDKYVEAIGSLSRALQYFEQEKNDLFIAKSNEVLASANSFLGKEELAYEHIRVALDLFIKLGSKRNEASSLNALAHIQFLRGDLVGAVQIILRASNIQSILKDSFQLASSYNNLGYMHEKLDEQDLAIGYYEKAVEIRRVIKPSSSMSLINLAAVYNDLGDLKKAKVFLSEALAQEQHEGRISVEKEIYDYFLRIAIAEKDTDKAFEYIAKRDSVSLLQLNVENTEKFKMIESEYELEVRSSQMEQELKINNKNRIIFISILFLVLLGGFMLFLKHKNTELKLTQDKMRLEQTVLRSQMNPHFIFNTLSAIQNSLMDNDSLKSASYLSRFAKLIRQNFEFVNKRFITLEEELDALKNYMDTQKLRFQDKFEYVIQISEEIDVDEVLIPPLLIQPFIENSIEHGFRNKQEMGRILIDIFADGDHICYVIKDNGSGYETRFKDNKIHSTDIFEKRMKLFGDKNSCTFKIDSSAEGTKIKFCLKL